MPRSPTLCWGSWGVHHIRHHTNNLVGGELGAYMIYGTTSSRNDLANRSKHPHILARIRQQARGLSKRPSKPLKECSAATVAAADNNYAPTKTKHIPNKLMQNKT